MSTRNTLGDRIREERERLGLSVGELAQMAGSHRTTICRVESGARRLSDKLLSRVAEALGVTPHYLLTGGNEPAQLGAQQGPVFQIQGKPKDRALIQIYPDDARTIRALAKRHGLTTAELVRQMTEFCAQST